jgi:5-methylcytosine-specific restriction endonuclease McrA
MRQSKPSSLKRLNKIMRNYNTNKRGSPFAAVVINWVWELGQVDARYPGYRKDTFGGWMKYTDYGKTTSYGWEVDHIIPVSRGGSDDLYNLQPLQWRNNRLKSDKIVRRTGNVVLK